VLSGPADGTGWGGRRDGRTVPSAARARPTGPVGRWSTAFAAARPHGEPRMSPGGTFPAMPDAAAAGQSRRALSRPPPQPRRPAPGDRLPRPFGAMMPTSSTPDPALHAPGLSWSGTVDYGPGPLHAPTS